ncbi:BZ3500_MvSof-1268-A1-R1_Chr3-1g05895 [Microbotryum saponariae]|uniref:26S proteasome regulatory subunit RPN3 n=1 Tax=Microbotryum saponariae TaxID=289078 RepID=A0A2X0LSI2_9BASI|nr:BZ3500_MvSof-1268-A1-R1_Chr3-1g05895 [Microbotryum saponariae]SDA05085.1 BZ3501_MvSof-1269-A2-R1_Chr3-1g05565 [Microbotryum saponariae]
MSIDNKPTESMAVDSAPTSITAADKDKAAAPVVDDYTVLEFNVKHNLALISKAVSLLERRFTSRALRSLPALRKKLGPDGAHLADLIRNTNIYSSGRCIPSMSSLRPAHASPVFSMPPDSPRKTELIEFLGNPSSSKSKSSSKPTGMDIDDDAAATPNASSTASHVVESIVEKSSKLLGLSHDRVSSASSTLNALADATQPASIATTKPTKKEKPDESKLVASNVPEGDVYVALLVLLRLIDSGDYRKGKELASSLLEQVTSLNRRTMDQLSSKIYFYWVRLHELSGDDTAPLRTTLLAAQRTAALRHDDDLQATLLPLLLRNYLEHHLYDQADRLVSKTTFPADTAGNAQLARWYYYVVDPVCKGRIRAIQLNYTEAHTSLQQAIRRAPDATTAPGFLQTAHKLSIVVELLMGEIPERSIFREPVLKKALVPYLEIVQAVRVGDLTKFNTALVTHAKTFSSDSTQSLIVRLRHNVIKTALRTLSLAYSRISLADVSKKLHLDSEEDAEYIIAKAIRDGVIDATIDHEKGYMQSRETGDVYATNEPQLAFDTRIKFLLDLHHQSVKAMRYPLNAHAKDLASAGEARERERELAKEIENADEDDDFGAGGDMDEF